MPVDPLSAYAKAAAEGDDKALASLIRATQPAVWRLCSALGSPGDEEDLVQEAYLRIIRALPSYRGESAVLPWMLSIARRVCADQVRRRVRQRRLADRLVRYLPSGEARDEDASGLDQLVDSLPRDRRDAFVVTQLLGFSYEHAATVLGCPIGTIRSRVARARQDLAAMVRRAEAQ